jgi:hypothetical protein
LAGRRVPAAGIDGLSTADARTVIVSGQDGERVRRELLFESTGLRWGSRIEDWIRGPINMVVEEIRVDPEG